MKTLTLFFMLSLSLFASGIDWHIDYDEALEEAQTRHKPVLVFMSHPSCPSCNYMKEKVFSDKRIEAYVTKNYIPLMVDISATEVPEHLRVKATPVFHFLNSRGEKTRESLIGGKTAPFFLKILQEAGNNDA